MDKNYHIGVLIGNVHTQHPMELIEGICEAARDENVYVTFFVGAQGNALDYWNEYDNELFAYNYQYNSFYDYSLIAGLDALIISYGTLCIYLEGDDREAFARKFRSVPLMILEEYDEDSCDSFMISDNYGGMRAVMEHLMGEHGYRRILYLSGPKNNTDSNEREKAYRDVMAAYGETVTDSMVEYGDYSSEVEALAERLLDHHPDAQAIVAANDEMALSIYRVCQKRGIVVGKDLAVTGYDDVQFAQRMDPPLTTVNQDGLVMGYRALKCAVGLCKDPTPVKMKIPAQFLNRCSCGCRTDVSDTADGFEECFARMEEADAAQKKALFSEVADISARSSFQSIASEKDLAAGKEYYLTLMNLIERIAEEDPEQTDVQNAIDEAVRILQKLCESRGNRTLNFSGFTRNFHRLMNCYLQKTKYTGSQALYGLILQASDTYLQSYVMRAGEEKVNLLLNRSWTGPATILHMIEKVDREEAFYQLALENIISQGAKSAYLYLLPEPLKCDRSSEFVCPEKMLLVAKYADGQVQTFEKGTRPCITAKEGFAAHYPETPGHTFVAFILFAKTYQYGIMLCEIEAASIGLLYGVALQISTAQAYMQISKRENETKQKLYATLEELKEKNQVLGFISATDALTGLYNRRGFMERAMNEVGDHAGKTAVLLFSDLDHLKQINDVFGHEAGDFALINASKILKETIEGFGGVTSISGRTGGDEFLSVMICENEPDTKEILAALKQACNQFNDTSEKPFYVEFSTGCFTFTCVKGFSIPELAGKADACLYEAKKSRRSSVLREDG